MALQKRGSATGKQRGASAGGFTAESDSTVTRCAATKAVMEQGDRCVVR